MCLFFLLCSLLLVVVLSSSAKFTVHLDLDEEYPEDVFPGFMVVRTNEVPIERKNEVGHTISDRMVDQIRFMWYGSFDHKDLELGHFQAELSSEQSGFLIQYPKFPFALFNNCDQLFNKGTDKCDRTRLSCTLL